MFQYLIKHHPGSKHLKKILEIEEKDPKSIISNCSIIVIVHFLVRFSLPTKFLNRISKSLQALCKQRSHPVGSEAAVISFIKL